MDTTDNITTRFYVAYSIHGTNSYYVAQRDIKGDEEYGLAVLGSTFTKVLSRRPNHNPAVDGVKLHWSRMRTVRDNQLLVDPHVVEKRFLELERLGWTISHRFDIKKIKRIQLEKRRAKAAKSMIIDPVM